MITDSFKYFGLMEKMEVETLMLFTEAKSQPSNKMNAFNQFLHGVECDRFDKECKNMKKDLNSLSNIYKLRVRKWCTQKSPQQIFYSMYKDIALAQLKVYILIEYSMTIQMVSGNGNFITERNTVRHNYDEITKIALSSLRNVTEKADRFLWRFDPSTHVPRVTYDEVTRLLQGYMENEVDLNTDESCRQTCNDYQNTTRSGCFEQKFCSQQPQCSGRIHNCQFIDSVLSVCQSPENSFRRYEYIDYSEGRRLGEKVYCERPTNKLESWNSFIFYKCNYCFCVCDEQGPKSDRYFNLRETLSDVKANKVVTGVRFVKENRILHLQIQQGELLPGGLIDNSTVDWEEVSNYKIDDPSVREGVDYHTLSYQRRSIDLDDVRIDDDKTLVVTGVGFQVLDGHLNLKVRFSKFDFVEGQLIDPEVNSVWLANDNIYERQKLNLDGLDMPIRSEIKSKPLSQDTQYLEFTNSDIYKDASQSTIPFIDIQDVASIPPVALSGVGIYYKGVQGYGGFVAPKIFSYDISPHLPWINN
ncbi:hypothetical protein KR093_005218 [Drosophila rubida]|uniref:Uncharacterized protein n=1 Tax=Drosophila rubida TaxID=30044 RepID=A0AAD4JZM8_9MUSC|nr:hypothetical protein KR093_005218 [Drosophila rubida]